MANRKINELSPRTPSLTDLIIVGDPSTGYSFKATISVLAAFAGSNIQFSSLQGISITSPTNGQALVYDGTNWVNQNISVPVTSVFGRTGVVVAAEGDYSLDLLSDVTLTSPTTNQVLQYNGTAWVNATFVAGINSLNGLTATTQTFATGTSGTDFAISSSTSTHTFNLPTASAVNRGALSSADWSTFNAKQDAITLTTTGSSGSSTLVGATLNVPTYTLAGLGGVSGSGTTNYLPKWTGSTALGNSLVFDNGTSVGINTSSPSALSTLDIVGTTGRLYLGNAPTAGGAGIRAVTANAASLTSFEVRSSATYYTGLNTFIIGGTTSAGYLLDVQGTFRSTLDANINGLTVGKGAGSASENTALGLNALIANTTAIENTASGYYSFRANTTGGKNTGFGYGTGYDNVSGIENTFVGAYAGRTSTASHNTMVGSQAGRTTTGGYNTFLGSASGYSVSTGTYNTILGYSNPGITTGNFNTIIGSQVTGLSSSLSNTIILADGQGNQRLYINSSGNVGIGTTSPQANHLLTLQSSGSSNQMSLGLRGWNNTDAGGVRFITNDGTSFDYYIFGNTTNGITFGTSAATYVQSINFATGTSGVVLGNSTALYIRGAASRDLDLGSNNTNSRMIIKSGGNVLIGTTTDGGYRLSVSGVTYLDVGTGTGAILRMRTNNSTSGYFYGDGSSALSWTGQFRVDGNLNLWNGINSGGYGKTYSWNSGIHTTVRSMSFSLLPNQAGTKGIFFQPNVDNDCDVIKLVDTAGTSTRFVVKNLGQVGIGIDSPNASALLDITSTTKGFLPPRMTNAQMVAIGTPASGLMVYDTTNNKLNVYDGTNWVAVH